MIFSKKKQIYRFVAILNLETLLFDIYIYSEKSARPIDLQFGTTISDRYVPQSRFSRMSDLNLKNSLIDEKIKIDLLKKLKNNNKVNFNLSLDKYFNL